MCRLLHQFHALVRRPSMQLPASKKFCGMGQGGSGDSRSNSTQSQSVRAQCIHPRLAGMSNHKQVRETQKAAQLKQGALLCCCSARHGPCRLLLLLLPTCASVGCCCLLGCACLVQFLQVSKKAV